MWYVRDILYAVLYVRVSCFLVRGCAVSRRYINVCNCDMFSVVYVYLDHLKFCVVCIDGRRYVCCSECDVISNECNEPTSCFVQPFGSHCCEVMYFGCFGFRGEPGFLNYDEYEISLTFTAGPVSLCCVCGHMVVFGLSMSLSWYPMWIRWLL